MRCCVPGCKNDSRYSSKSQGITFHVFPNEPGLRSSWLQALGKKESWEPKERSAICSEHFLCEDLYETKSGLRKARTGAVPLIVQDSSNCEYGEPAAPKLTIQNLQSINRINYQLTSNLNTKLYYTIHGDLPVNPPPEEMKTENDLRESDTDVENEENSNQYIVGDLPAIHSPEETKTENDLRESATDVENEENSSLYIDCDVPAIHSPEEMKTENDLRESDTDVEKEENSNLYIDGDLPAIPSPEEIKTENDLRESDTDVENEENSSLYIYCDVPAIHSPEEKKTENDLRESDTDVENEENSNLYIDGDLPAIPSPEEIKTENDLRESDTDVENEENSSLYIYCDVPAIHSPEEMKTENDLRESDTDVENEENSNLYIDGDLPAIPSPEEMKTENDLRESDTDIENEENSSLYIDCDVPAIHSPEEMKTENDLRESDTDVENEENSYLYIDGDLPAIPSPEEMKTENDLRESDTDVENEENSDEIILIIEIDEDNVQNNDYSTDDSLPVELDEIKKVLPTKRKKAVKKVPEVPKIDRRRKPYSNDDLSETLFTITNMTIEEQIDDVQKRQEGPNYKNSVFKCTECYKGYKDQVAYNSHMLRHTTKCGVYRCSVCKIHFKTSHRLCTHITQQHTERLSCNLCSYITTHRLSARLHESWHKGKVYNCPHCTDEFDKFTTYMGHIRIKHPSDFVCQLCGYSFVSEKGLVQHKKLKHRWENTTIPEDAPTCDLCNLRFMNMNALERHIKVSARHNTTDSTELDRPQTRDEKGKRKKRVGGDRADGPIPCEQCGVQLKDWRAYNGHFRRMHYEMNRTIFPSTTTTCMCEVCGKILQNYTHLKDHRWLHTGEIPFKCDICGKSYRTKQRLTAHRRIKHFAEKTTYACDMCGKQFSSYANKRRHMYIHTGVKPFKCEICGKYFMHMGQKSEHINYVHLKKPWPKRSRGKRRQDGRPVPA